MCVRTHTMSNTSHFQIECICTFEKKAKKCIALTLIQHQQQQQLQKMIYKYSVKNQQGIIKKTKKESKTLHDVSK